MLKVKNNKYYRKIFGILSNNFQLIYAILNILILAAFFVLLGAK